MRISWKAAGNYTKSLSSGSRLDSINRRFWFYILYRSKNFECHEIVLNKQREATERKIITAGQNRKNRNVEIKQK